MYEVKSIKQKEFYRDKPEFVDTVFDTVFRNRKGSRYVEVVKEMHWKEFEFDENNPPRGEELEFLKVCYQSLKMVDEYFDGQVNYYCNSIREYAKQRNKDEQENGSSLEHLFS